MTRSSSRTGTSVRALLVVTVVVTAIATHLINRATLATFLFRGLRDPVNEMAGATAWLNDYYASPEGLQRENGLWVDGHIDTMGVSTWIVNTYLRARLNGASEDEARLIVIEGIQKSEEWRAKHPDRATAR